MRKVKYRCPACKKVQWVEYSPILFRSLQCRKCQARFNAFYSQPDDAANQKKRTVGVPAGVRPSSLVPRLSSLVSYPLSALRKESPGLRYLLLLLIAVTLIVFGFGFVHVITGSNLSAPHIILKSSFGYSETFIKIDRITGMLWVFAIPMNVYREKYPVGCRVLQETGHIESDEAFESRISREFVQLHR